jgi:hypothetical protein
MISKQPVTKVIAKIKKIGKYSFLSISYIIVQKTKKPHYPRIIQKIVKKHLFDLEKPCRLKVIFLSS